MKNKIKVVAAIIIKDNKIFVAQRAYGFLKGKWEFPGGKVKDKETDEQALQREIIEELDTTISVDKFFTKVIYDYDDFILDMNTYICHVIKGKLEIEKGIHLNEAWLSLNQLDKEDFCPADSIIAEKIKEEKIVI